MDQDLSHDPTTGELVSRLSQQISTLLRDELRLAQAELQVKTKKGGIGVGLFGIAVVIAVFAIGSFIAAAILGLANTVDGWLAATIVGAGLLVLAGLVALTGKREVTAAVPPVPQEAISGVHKDIAAMRRESTND
jgi:membrane protein